MDQILNDVDAKIIDINETVKQNNTNISSNIQILENIKEDLKSYIDIIKDLKSKSTEFENEHSKEKYEELKTVQLKRSFIIINL